MKRVIYLTAIILLLICSCTEQPTKPFVITRKSNYTEDFTMCKYVYVGVNGKKEFFFDKSDMYQIGDTIK